MSRTHFKTPFTAALDFWLRLRQILQKIRQRSYGYASGFSIHFSRLAQKSSVSLTRGF